jgi:thiol-disulfide isomerase/thioredoxin
LHFGRWLNTEKNQPLDTAGSVTLYRWWTDTCPYCAATLPAIEKLGATYGPKGLKIVAVYHPKPPREVTDQSVRDAAGRIGYQGAIAIDADWAQLRKLYLSTGKRGATSVSFLVDRSGVIRFVHPGVQYFPSDKPEDAEHDADFRLIDKAIGALLEEKATN